MTESVTIADEPRTSAVGRNQLLDHVFLVGLAGVFIVNAAVAVVHPHDFTGLVERSSLGRFLRLDGRPWLASLIAANDLALGAAVLAAVRFTRARAAVLAWTGLWLLAVTVIKFTALG